MGRNRTPVPSKAVCVRESGWRLWLRNVSRSVHTMRASCSAHPDANTPLLRRHVPSICVFSFPSHTLASFTPFSVVTPLDFSPIVQLQSRPIPRDYNPSNYVLHHLFTPAIQQLGIEDSTRRLQVYAVFGE